MSDADRSLNEDYFEQRMLARNEKRQKKLAEAPCREAKVESNHVARVKRDGGISAKWVSPGWAGVTDRIDLYGVKPMRAALLRHLPGLRGIDDAVLRDMLAAAIQFSEIKKPGGKPEPHQARVHATLCALGFTVNVIDKP